jgi:predicted HicB family RNase H-like nuclease
MSTPRKRGRPPCRIENVAVNLTMPSAMKAKIRALAAEEGLSLATWVRRLAIRELNRLAA